MQDLLHSRLSIDARPDPTRGFDHGTFSLMKPLYPNEDIPVVQLSLDAGYDPALHLKVGRALAPLREEGVLIIGSGLSYHNLSAIQGTAGHGPSRQFDAWLQETLIRSPSEMRTERLVEWEKAPAARAAHPREDHLIPLMVAVGAAEDEPGAVTYHQKDFVWRPDRIELPVRRCPLCPSIKRRCVMTSATFKPIVYLKENCPFCLKVRLFLLESGLASDVETRDFVPDSEQEAKIRAELQPHLDKVSFPSAQLEPGRYVTESDDIVAFFAAKAGRDPA